MVLFGEEEAKLVDKSDQSIWPVNETGSELIDGQRFGKVEFDLFEARKGVRFDLVDKRQLLYESVDLLQMSEIGVNGTSRGLALEKKSHKLSN